METINGIPRRNRLDLNTPAELAIYNAMGEVERCGASESLTKAVMLLQEAKNALADHIEGIQQETNEQLKVINYSNLGDDTVLVCNLLAKYEVEIGKAEGLSSKAKVQYKHAKDIISELKQLQENEQPKRESDEEKTPEAIFKDFASFNKFLYDLTQYEMEVIIAMLYEQKAYASQHPIEQENWTLNKVIDFVNWHLKVCQLPERYELENQSIIDSFLNGDTPELWHNKYFGEQEKPSDSAEEFDRLIKSIRLDSANLEYISKKGIINGTLYIEIKRILSEYASQKHLPTDEEIHLEAQKRHYDSVLIAMGFEEGAKWLRD